MNILKISKVLILLLFINSCKNQNNEIIKGSIYIKSIDFGSLYKASKKQFESTKEEVDNYDFSKEKDSEKDFYSYYKVLFEENLADKPFALIKDEQGDIKRVFFSLEDYKDIEILLNDLNKQTEQIDINLEAKKVHNGLYYATKVLFLEKVEGKTEWDK